MKIIILILCTSTSPKLLFSEAPNYYQVCRNSSFGLATKAKGLQGCGPRGSPGVKAKRLQGCGPRGSSGITSHTPENVRAISGAKTQCLVAFFISLEISWNLDV